MISKTRKILVLINNYMPIKTADGFCFKNILDILKERYEIVVVTIGDKKGIDCQDGLKVISISSEAYIDQVIMNKLSTCRINMVIKLLLKRMLSFFFKGVKCLLWPDLSILRYRDLKKVSLDLVRSKNLNTIIAVSGSFTTQIVGLKIKRLVDKIRIISVLYDPIPMDSFIYSKSVNFISKKIVSERVIKHSDYCLTTKPLLERYVSRYGYKKKLIQCGIPMIKDLIIKDYTENSSKITSNEKFFDLLYVGSLNYGVRNPEYWFKLVAASKIENLRIHIIGDEYCKSSAKKQGVLERCVFHGFLNREDIMKFYTKKFILVNLGNYNNFQIPSKIFEYMSSGLPIVSIEPNIKSPTKYLLERYKNSLTIEEKNLFVENVTLFDTFINTPHSKLSFRDIANTFYEHTPQWNAEILTSIIEDEMHVE